MPAPSDTRLQRRALDAAFDLAAAQATDGMVPFVILGIADSRGTLRLEAFGPANGPRIGTDAVCAIASISKPLVATAVMRQVQAGRLDPTEPLTTWLPELDRPGRLPFGAWHVLSHTTGMDDLDMDEVIAEGCDREEMVRRIVALPSVAPPGSRFQYATSTFDLLVEAVGRHMGRPFETILHDEVLEPLGMVDTGFDPRPERTSRMAPLLVQRPGGEREPHDPEVLDRFLRLHIAGGGMCSTASDLLRFGRAMLRGGELDGARVLAPAFVDLMTREVTVGGLGRAPDPLASHHYALGWGKPGIASPASATAFGHGGASGTRLWIDPEHDLVSVYLSGVWGLPLAPIDAVEHAVYAALPRAG